MTTEVQEYKCPSCGHQLGNDEFLHVCEKIQRQNEQAINERLALKDEEIRRLKIEHAQRLPQEAAVIAEKLMKQRMESTELKHRDEIVNMKNLHRLELAQKDKLIEDEKTERDNYTENKIKQVILNNELKHRQKEKESQYQIKRLTEQVVKLQRTLDNIPSWQRGNAGEFILVEELERAFKNDKIIPKRVGVAMADAVQFIVTEQGETVSTPIVYDKKTGETITKLDILKAKNYKTVHNTDYCIIVTENGIKDNSLTEERDGILIVHQSIVVDIAKQIRAFLIENSKQLRNNLGRESKMEELYTYFTSPEYYRDVKAKLDAKSELDEIRRNEQDYHKRMWNREKELIDEWFELDNKSDRKVNDLTQSVVEQELTPDGIELEDGKDPFS